ncbi:MAG: putative metalloprotease CJM1_0395 family protein [Planctomycetota bacterium]
MSAIGSIAPTAFVSRPQAPSGAARPSNASATREPERQAPVREPDGVELSPAVIAPSGAGGVEPVRAVERSESAGVEAPKTELSEAEREQVRELKARDAEVKAHEQAHVAAAGPYYRGGPTYSYQQGPDGNRYAVGGSVQIDTSPVPGDPEATIAKAQTVRRAALAPAEPSTTDQQVAAAASKMEAQARQELNEQRASREESDDARASGGVEDVNGSGGTDPDEQGTDADATDPTLTRTSAGEQKNANGETQGGLIDVFG